jgi:hypothetical protein
MCHHTKSTKADLDRLSKKLTCKDQAGIFFLADLKRILERYGNRAAAGPSR